MIIDNTIAEIIVEIQKEFKLKYNKDLDFDKVAEIIDIQLSATSFAFSRCVPIYWKGFLKFIWTDRRARNKAKYELINTINNPDNNFNDRQLEYFNYLGKIESHTKFKELEALNLKSKGLTADEVSALPTKSIRFLNFKSIITHKRK